MEAVYGLMPSSLSNDELIYPKAGRREGRRRKKRIKKNMKKRRKEKERKKGRKEEERPSFEGTAREKRGDRHCGSLLPGTDWEGLLGVPKP